MIHLSRVFFAAGLLALLLLLSGCGKHGDSQAAQLTLDWKPEPEFGGFYAAQANGAFTVHDLKVDIQPAGEGADTWQLVATGKTEFATTAADQVIIARAHGADVVAIFAVYQTSPQGIMVHPARGFKKLEDVFTHEGVLLAEDNSWLHYLEKKFAPIKVTVSGYDGGISLFLAKPNYSQQCFITSEPLQVRRQTGEKPQTFLIADSGFNPYTTVVICKGSLWQTNPDRVRSMIAACKEGWQAYLNDPTATNAIMHGLNPDMDLQTFAEAAAAQKPLIETPDTDTNGLGSMTVERWNTLSTQLQQLGVIDKPINGQDCFVGDK